MSVTRVEGTRPLEAITTIATPQPRTGTSTPKPAAANRPAPQGSEQQPEPVSIFKPFSLLFRYDEDLHRVVVKVIDPKTGETLREIPPESVLEALKSLKKAPGSLVDEEV